MQEGLATTRPTAPQRRRADLRASVLFGSRPVFTARRRLPDRDITAEAAIEGAPGVFGLCFAVACICLVA